MSTSFDIPDGDFQPFSILSCLMCQLMQRHQLMIHLDIGVMSKSRSLLENIFYVIHDIKFYDDFMCV